MLIERHVLKSGMLEQRNTHLSNVRIRIRSLADGQWLTVRGQRLVFLVVRVSFQNQKGVHQVLGYSADPVFLVLALLEKIPIIATLLTLSLFVQFIFSETASDIATLCWVLYQIIEMFVPVFVILTQLQQQLFYQNSQYTTSNGSKENKAGCK